MNRAIKYNVNKIQFYSEVLTGTNGAYVKRQLAVLRLETDNRQALRYSRIVLGKIGEFQGYTIQAA